LLEQQFSRPRLGSTQFLPQVRMSLNESNWKQSHTRNTLSEITIKRRNRLTQKNQIQNRKMHASFSAKLRNHWCYHNGIVVGKLRLAGQIRPANPLHLFRQIFSIP